MRRVKLITGLKVEERTVYGDHIEMHSMFSSNILLDGKEVMEVSESEYSKEVIPIHEFHKRCYQSHTKEPEIQTTYIAYSPEIEGLLEIPIKAIEDQNSALKASNDGLRDDIREVQRLSEEASKIVDCYYESFWLRLKFLFTGKMEEQSNG